MQARHAPRWITTFIAAVMTRIGRLLGCEIDSE